MLWLSKNIYKTLNAQKTPQQFILTGNLWGVYCKYFREFWPYDNGTTLYMLDGHINHNMLPFK